MTISTIDPDDFKQITKGLRKTNIGVSGSSISTESSITPTVSQTDNLESDESKYLTSKPKRKKFRARIVND